jgi:uracil-DNA glycosylase family 4
MAYLEKLTEQMGVDINKPLMGQGRKGARIMVVQESPYMMEWKARKYMGGRGGAMMRAAFGEVGIDIDDVYFTSIVKFPTPEDRIPSDLELKEGMDLMWAEIEIINPEIIIPTGNLSMKYLMKQTAITKCRGKLYVHDDRKYFPMIHPNLVLKQPKYLQFFSEDMINLESVLNGTKVAGRASYERERLYCETYDSAIDEIMRLMKLPKGTKVVVDLETVKVNPFIARVTSGKTTADKFPESLHPKIVAIGFADRPGYGSAIPLYHRETPFSGNQLGTIVKFLRWLFEESELEFVAHNGKFDIKWLKAWLDIQVKELIWDTMLIHYLTITEEKGTHGLKDLAWLETDMGGYDDALDSLKPTGEDEGNYDLIPWDVLKVYLADDCDVTYRLLEKYIANVTEDPEYAWIWENLMVPGYYTLLDIECDGVYVDRKHLKYLQDNYPSEIERVESKLHQFPEVIDMKRERVDRWAERCAIGQIKKANRTPEQQEKFTKYKKYDPKDGGDKLNFGSVQQLSELLFERLGLETDVLTDKGNPSTNDDSLKVMLKQHPICSVLMEWRKVNHLNNNFVAGMTAHLDPNGLVHPSYNIHGTVTGRLSSNEPNAQQFPRKSNDIFSFQYWHEIKTMFVSRFGDDGVIVQFDYSQLELRILAVFSQDPTLINLYRSGADLHKAVASDAFGVPIEEVTKDQRTASKKIQFGVVYQESARGLSEDLRAEGINMTDKQCQAFIDKYFRRFPYVEKWVKEIKRFAKRNKYVLTKTKRRRNLPTIDSTDRSVANEAERQAVNAPIQSTGSDCTLMSLILINKWLRDSGYRSRICITVHDSIVLDCPKDEVIVVAKKVKHIMENLAEYNPFYEFLGDVPVVSEMEIGYSYGEAFECTIEELEELGVDGYLTQQLSKKKAKEEEAFRKADENGTKIAHYVRGYWDVA